MVNTTLQHRVPYQKTSLKMAPSHIKHKVVIQVSNRTGIRVQNILRAEFTKLEFMSQIDRSVNCTKAYLSISDVDLLLATKVLITSCQLCLQGKITATISESTTFNSPIYLFSDYHSHNITIRYCTFHFSILKISNSFTGRDLTTESALSLESNSIINLFVIVKLQVPIIYKLVILDTSINSPDSRSLDTGIKVETFNTSTVYVFIRNSSIVGNYQSVNISTYDFSHVELVVDQCYIANNGNEKDTPGGIEAFHPNRSNSNSVTIINISSTILSGNKYAQIGIYGYSGTTAVTVFNCTISITGGLGTLSGDYNAGAHFEFGSGYI